METRRLSDLIAEARDYLDRECNVSQWPNLVSQLVDALEAVTAERDKAKRGAKTLGEIVGRQVEDNLRWAGMEDQIGMDDPDQQLAWERCAEMPGRIASLTAERDEALAVIAEVRNAMTPVYPASLGPTGEEVMRILSRIPEHPKED